jgi:hypothetical protein
MSLEEDYLMVKVRDLESRVVALEALWAGSSSPTSTPKRPPSTPGGEPNGLPPAPTTGSLSTKDPEGSSTAPSTGGPGPGTPKANDGKAVWAAFVESNGYPGDPWGVTKAELIDWWRERSA